MKMYIHKGGFTMSSVLRFETYEMPAASLGKPSPLPDIKTRNAGDGNMKIDYSVITEAEADSLTYGRKFAHTALPYTMLDRYDRNKKPRKFNAAIFENSHIKAIVLPELGGRLWSLFDKDAGQELLHVNPVFQPANFAIRNAWISGGVEWNLSQYTGHTAFTVDQLFTASYTMSDGTPALRMYEWERVRKQIFCLDMFLPEDSKYLYVRVEIINTTDEEVPVYWWSNTAIEQLDGVRVIVPAEKSYGMKDGRYSKVGIPVVNGVDKSYPFGVTAREGGGDGFYDIPTGKRSWEGALNKNGYGFVTTATDRLVGRKLFMYTNSPGGNSWQTFLSEPGHAYFEIQGGLAKSQQMLIPMPPNAKWDWLEAYGPLQADPSKVHSNVYSEAYTNVGEALEIALPKAELNKMYEFAAKETNVKIEPSIVGTGWAALEAARLSKEGKTYDTGNLIFSESTMGCEQKQWLELLNTGIFPEACIDAEPVSYMTQPEWLAMLEESVKSGKSNHWYAWLHLGVMYYARNQTGKACDAFKKSNKLKKNPWAIRNIGAIRRAQDEKISAAEYLLEAAEMLPHISIAIEAGKDLIAAKMYEEFRDFEKKLPEDIRKHDRILACRVETAIYFKEYDIALEILKSNIIITDLREGELALSDLWISLHTKIMIKETGADEASVTKEAVLKKYPLPKHLDFRMGHSIGVAT